MDTADGDRLLILLGRGSYQVGSLSLITSVPVDSPIGIGGFGIAVVRVVICEQTLSRLMSPRNQIRADGCLLQKW